LYSAWDAEEEESARLANDVQKCGATQLCWSATAKYVELWGRPRTLPASETQSELLAQARWLKGGEVAKQISITVDSQVC